jgi:hypothetical protein
MSGQPMPGQRTLAEAFEGVRKKNGQKSAQSLPLDPPNESLLRISTGAFTRRKRRRHALATCTNNEHSAVPAAFSGHSRKRQAFLDVGQRAFGPQPCPECGMLFSRGVPEDEAAHSHYHARALSQTALGCINSCARERCVARNVCNIRRSRLVSFFDCDTFPVRRQAASLCANLEATLGFEHGCLCSSDPLFSSPRGSSRILLLALVSSGGYVLAAIVCERVSRAFCVHNSSESRPAVVGVYALYVEPSIRRKGVATALCDYARSLQVPGYIAARSEIAFSQPTSDGVALQSSLVRGTSSSPLALQ